MHELRVGATYVGGLIHQREAGELAGTDLEEAFDHLAKWIPLESAVFQAVIDTLLLEVGQAPSPERIDTELKPWLEPVVEAAQAWTARHTMVLQIPDQAPSVCVDRERGTAVLVCLLNNAVKFSPGGVVRVVRTPKRFAHPTHHAPNPHPDVSHRSRSGEGPKN